MPETDRNLSKHTKKPTLALLIYMNNNRKDPETAPKTLKSWKTLDKIPHAASTPFNSFW